MGAVSEPIPPFDHIGMQQEIRVLMSGASSDELRAFLVIARRVMTGGRKQYGPLDLATDRRSWSREAADEMADYLWYCAIREVVAADRVKAFADALDSAACESSTSGISNTEVEGVATSNDEQACGCCKGPLTCRACSWGC